jgi:hypothetical protein
LSAAARSDELFRKGGDPYLTFPKILLHDLKDLVPEKELAATVNAVNKVVLYLVDMFWEGRLDPLLTDKVIAAELGISRTTVQRALHALDVVMGRIGKPIIRRIRTAGRRVIEFIRGFASRNSTGSTAPPAPPINTPETTTTSGPSSFLRSAPENAGAGREVASAELIARACRLIPEATPGKVAEAVAAYGADWVSRALDRVAKRNANRDNKPVKSWGFVLNTLKNWTREGGPGPQDPPPAPPPVKAKVEPPEEGPSPRLTAEEVADLVGRCRSRKPMAARLARIELRLALDQGGIPAESMELIPAELVEPVEPRPP